VPRSASRARLDTIPAVGRTAPGVDRKRHPLLTALRFSVWSLTLLAVVAGLALLLFLHRGDPEGSARLANREIEFLLEPGEVVEQRAAVRQRHWWHYFRVTHGVLAATDRRLIYLGVPPAELLPRDEEPPIFEQTVFAYGPVAVRKQRVFLGTLPGVVLSADRQSATFGYSPAERPRVDRVLGLLERKQFAMHEAAEQERLAQLAAIEAARQPKWHVVARGEALESIALQYGTTVQNLKLWNNLASDRIKSGQRLLVKPRT
jgi:LysM domain